MTRAGILAAGWLVAAAAMVPSAGAAGDAKSPNLCTLCHPDVRVQFESSIHAREEVSCVSCHGGDATASTVQAAHSGDFRAARRRRDVPALCGTCHADADRMGPYNLPTEQLALYQTSAHGRALAKGDEKVAVCTDCHGVHEILRHDDPRSSVFPQNVPATCGRCHANAALMKPYGHSGDPFADFAGSVHGEALLKHGNLSAPDCSRCHGAHGATPPGVGNVDKVCGQCHAPARAHFLDSPHRQAMPAAGLPECASCHGNHAIRHADISRLEETCASCHDAGSAPAELAMQMKTVYSAAADQVDRALARVDEAAAIPLYTEDYRARIEDARTALTEVLPAMHSLDLDRVEGLAERARSIGDEVESEVEGKIDALAWRRVGLLIFWFYLLLTVGILVRFRRKAASEAGS